MKVLRSFSHQPFAKKLLDDIDTERGVQLLFAKIKEVGKTHKRIRGSLMRLLPEHPYYGNYATDIDAARQLMKETELNIELLIICLGEIKMDALAHLKPPESFLEICDRSLRHLREAKQMAAQSAVDLNELESILSSEHAQLEKAAT